MSVKHFVLLLLFLLNSAVTVFADSIHIEIETHSSSIEHATDHHDTPEAADSSEEHCQDHDACHSGHYHHYLTSDSITPIGSTLISFINFNFPACFYVSNFLDVIKPPLLLS